MVEAVSSCEHARMTATEFELRDRLGAVAGTVAMSGQQALLRVTADQQRADAARGLRTAGLIAGYRGSPLAGVDDVYEQNRAVLEGDRPIRDNEVIPACQQSCPAEAIVFGNVKDHDSRVAHLVENERTYRVLDALINTQPAVNYLKKVTFHEVADGGH